MLAALMLSVLAMAGCAATNPPPGGMVTPVDSRPGSGKAAAIIRTARSLIGTPYVWGGHEPSTGFDCSGLVWYAFHKNGVTLPRISWQQFGVGSPVHFHELRAGDLVFHKVDSKGKSLHVGIVTDRGTFVHAPSSSKQVMESSLSNVYWSKHFVGARRVL
jgi:cell wall-associated NlpC family hydrolase